MSSLFWYKIVFMTELLIAEIMLSYSAPQRSMFWLRSISAVAVCYALAFLYPVVDGNYTWYGSSIMFFVLFCVTVAGLWFCFKLKFLKVVFCAVTAYAVQHIAYETFSLVNIALFKSDVFTDNAYGSGTFLPSMLTGVGAFGVVLYLFVYTCLFLLAYVTLHKRIAQSVNLDFKHISVLGFTAIVLVITITLSAVSQYAMPATDIHWKIMVCVYNILCCLLVFYIHISMVRTRDAEYEKAVITGLFRQYQKNYKASEENIKLINRKCHDFKYQIRTFVGSRGIADAEYVDELSELISIYDTNIHTGNDALDIILAEKSLQCHDKGITLTSLADGKSVSFMKSGEVYALFGNILDNAIEATLKVSDEAKRCINLHVNRKNDFTVINTDNYYDGEMKITADGLPQTTKPDAGNHGFGMKSVRALVEKYGGTLYISAEDNVFRLSIVFADNFE